MLVSPSDETFLSSSYGNRTHLSALKEQHPEPIDERAVFVFVVTKSLRKNPVSFVTPGFENPVWSKPNVTNVRVGRTAINSVVAYNRYRYFAASVDWYVSVSWFRYSYDVRAKQSHSPNGCVVMVYKTTSYQIGSPFFKKRLTHKIEMH